MTEWLWYSDNKGELEDLIREAVQFFEEKYQEKAVLVYVKDPDGLKTVDGVAVEKRSNILPRHIWVVGEKT